MHFLIDFLHQKAPKSSKDIPLYYQRGLATSEYLLAVYFAVCMLVLQFGCQRFSVVPLIMILAIVACRVFRKKLGARIHLALYTAITCFWCGWFIHECGWGCGGQHALMPVLMLVFFNVFEPPYAKIAYFVALLAYRIMLFAYTLQHGPIMQMSTSVSIFFQMTNSLMLFLILASLCIVFSTNLQATERKLRIDNQELHKEAGTDPLTGLMNRRSMTDEIELFRKKFPHSAFSVAMTDIDFFKKVNDTYGHLCGDYTLQKLTELFQNESANQFSVSRWGGEEFCFFLPECNIDDANLIMHRICLAVEHMKLEFEDHEFSITITIGIEENDFSSSLDQLLESADQKLYIGKSSGRNRVVA